MDRRGPVYPQGSNPPGRHWIARAFGTDGKLLGIAQGLEHSEAVTLAGRWLERLPGCARTEAVER